MKRTAAILLCLALSACAGQRAYEDGLSLIDQGRPEDGLARIDEAMKLEPGNYRYRQAYFRERDAALQRYAALADNARQQQQWDAAEAAYRRMLALAPDNARARAGLETLKTERRQ